nr:glycoside hydrolase family 15 protein [Halochromatium glycolicum]
MLWAPRQFAICFRDSISHFYYEPFLVDAARARITLDSSLPSESLSKEVDAATLSVVGFPAFAVEDAQRVDATVDAIAGKLEGRYGCKRFLRDGHQTVIEDHERLHYEPEELLQLEHIECEWPLFFTYLLLHKLRPTCRNEPVAMSLDEPR